MREKDLEKLRKEIDKIDDEILRLLNKRGKLVREVGKLKVKEKISYFDPTRQAKILERLKEKNKGPYPYKAIENIFKEIFSASIALEKSLSIGFLGDEGSFTHQAAIKKFGKSLKFLSYETIPDIFEAVSKEWISYGVVPVENSTGGMVMRTLDMFLEYDLNIVGEVILNIEHHLISFSKKLENIKKIYSHPQAFAQCKKWIRENLPKVKLIEVPHTSYGVKLLSEEKNTAAIGSELSAEIYKVPILYRSIQDFNNNQTRFLIIGKGIPARGPKNKTSIVLSIADRVGALFEILMIFKIYNINLKKIESYPNKLQPWQYVFFIDFEGHIEEKIIKQSLEELREKCSYFKILGAYPVD